MKLDFRTGVSRAKPGRDSCARSLRSIQNCHSLTGLSAVRSPALTMRACDAAVRFKVDPFRVSAFVQIEGGVLRGNRVPVPAGSKNRGRFFPNRILTPAVCACRDLQSFGRPCRQHFDGPNEGFNDPTQRHPLAATRAQPRRHFQQRLQFLSRSRQQPRRAKRPGDRRTARARTRPKLSLVCECHNRAELCRAD